MIDLTVPGDKSISHRVLILGALSSDGAMTVRGILDSADIRSTANVLRACGVEIPELSADFSFRGAGLRGLRAPASVLDCGNSGTTARLMMGVVAGQDLTAEFDGDASLRSRPMRRVTEPLSRMGARIRELGEPDRLPLQIQGGALAGITIENEKSSAQVKSAVLLAGLVAGVGSVVREPSHSRDHTERLLSAMGAAVRTVVEQGEWMVELDPVAEIHAITIDVPGDFSSAAFLLARGLLAGPAVRISGVGVNTTRTGLLDVVRRMQGAIYVSDRHESGHEPIATVSAEPCDLRGAHVEGAEIPHLVDEVPILAVLAARAEGETVIAGASELRVKETDRLKSIAENLRAVGAQAEERADGLIITGSSTPLRGRIRTMGDHRIAMAFGVLGSLPGNEISMDDVACVDVSFPDFWHRLRKISG